MDDKMSAHRMKPEDNSDALTPPDLYEIVFKEYPDLMNVKQLSSLLDVSTKTVYCLIQQKKLQTTKVGREYRVPKYELLRYLDIISADNEQTP